jgi:drug/metabolite transporter (DMT)-like permease
MGADANPGLRKEVPLPTAAPVEYPKSAARLGLFLGLIAVVFWAFGASLVFFGAQQTGTWPFVTLASLVGGVLQLLCCRVYRGELRTAIRLPWRLWLGPVFCFVLYGLAWPLALVGSTTRQVVGVSLINYLWPTLTVLFSVWCVPGVRLTPKIILALLLALAGLALANYKPIQTLLSGAGGQAPTLRHFLPYGLATVAAITWAIYSTLLARWRSWAGNYVTSPWGFILIGLVGAMIMVATGTVPRQLTGLGTILTIFYGAGPLAIGYLLWEIALSKARVQALSLIAALTPVLSTLLLCFFLRHLPGGELICAAVLVSAGVVLSMRE